MRRGLLPNLDFEYQLRGTPVPKAARSQRERWSHILRLVPGWEHAVPIPDAPPEQFDAVLAWGASAAARDTVGPAAEGWPDPNVVRRVNDKRFSHECEKKLGVVLDGAVVVEDLDQLEEAVSRLPRWIAKHPFGVSGRDQLRGVGTMDFEQRRAATNLLAGGFGLVVEPLVSVTDELSLHYDVSQEAVRFVGATGLLTDSRGIFRGNVAPLTGVSTPIVETAGRAAVELKNLGYHGPVGIDALRGTVGGRPTVRPIVEINARWTFGRLALELASRLGDTGVRWHHPSRSEAAKGDPLPEDVDPGGRSRTRVERIEPARWF